MQLPTDRRPDALRKFIYKCFLAREALKLCLHSMAAYEDYRGQQSTHENHYAVVPRALLTTAIVSYMSVFAGRDSLFESSEVDALQQPDASHLHTTLHRLRDKLVAHRELGKRGYDVGIFGRPEFRGSTVSNEPLRQVYDYGLYDHANAVRSEVIDAEEAARTILHSMEEGTG